MPIRAMPAPIAGMAIGSAIRRKLFQGPTPRQRQASSWRRPQMVKLSVLSRKT